VPAYKYLFLGDNRSHSFDSRSWKEPFISVKNIKGKAEIILFPFDRVTKLK
jgi:signal peptidase I